MSVLPFPSDLPDVVCSQNARTVLEKRYVRKDRKGEPLESITGLFWRVASSIASEETKYEGSTWQAPELAKAFYCLLQSLKFLPNSPTLMNAGTSLGQLAACFVLPVGDSIEEIFDAVKYAALIHKSGGGTGFSFSRLRPKESRVGSTGGVASGPLSFLRIFNTATEQIKQGGTRRGANMGILRVDHPDIVEFIKAKEKEGELNNFNLSVALTEVFMQAVEQDALYDLVDPSSGEKTASIKARAIFELLVEKAWQSGDPGIVFLDRINKDNPTPDQGEIESTNPCGEQPLLPYEACNLGSINLAKFVLAGKSNPADSIDWDDLKQTIELAVRFLDNVIDASRYPLDSITEVVHRNRKIGLGIMGFADLLFQLGIPYDSDAGLELAEQLMDFIQKESRLASQQLAVERGPFPGYPSSIFAAAGKGPFRNATTTTIAPTGTLSIIGECSSGIEPLFALSFERHVMDGEKLLEANRYFEQTLKDLGYYSKELMQEVANKGTIGHLDQLPEEMRRVYVTAMDIDPEAHLRMQAAFQKYTDNAVSKTVNLPHLATQQDIRRIYTLAFELGCKGVTVYRDGCKSVQVLCTGEKGQEQAEHPDMGRKVQDRPDMIFGFTQKIQLGLGELYLTVNEIDGKPFEVFATIGKSGRSITAKAEAIGRLVSLALRSGIEVRDIVKQLKGIGGEHPIFQKKGLLLSLPDAVAWVLENRYLKEDKVVRRSMDLDSNKCPECGGELVFQEGCHICRECSYTKCG